MTPGRSVAVRVPATSANLGPGFDTLGLALSVHDELVVTVLPEPGLEIRVTGEGAADVPTDASHLVVRSMAYAFEACGRTMPGIRLTAHAGAGIVAGSDPETEMLETRVKFRPIVDALA